MKKARKPISQYHKQKVYRLYRNKCIFCGIGKNLQIHHIDTDRSNDKLENLLLVCSSCHIKCHGWGIAKKYKKKIIALRRRGYSFGDIADKLGLLPKRVGTIVAKESKLDTSIEKDNWENFTKRCRNKN